MTSRPSALLTLLERRRPEVLERWRQLLFGSYPAEAARFFRAERDGFRNPVGHTLEHGTATIFDGVALERPGDPVPDALEAIVRIRAIQDFSVPEAVGFVFQLKRAIRETLADELHGSPLIEEVLELESRIDGLALTAFQMYAQCREQVHTLRINASRRRSAALVERLAREDGRRGPGPRPEGRQWGEGA